jgi:DNA-3-methyladenine glycosylase II
MESDTRDRSIAQAYDVVSARDPVLRHIVATRGRPDPFSWPGGGDAGLDNFAALVLHIVSQQLSTRVATLLFGRILDAAGDPVTPTGVVTVGASGLHALGLSRAKAASLANLAELHLSGELDSDHLDSLDDEDVVTALTAARGVGRWTAEMFLIHQLRRPDVLPAGDLGIRKAVQTGWNLPTVPGIEDVQEFGVRWAPLRTYAAALLWASIAV